MFSFRCKDGPATVSADEVLCHWRNLGRRAEDEAPSQETGRCVAEHSSRERGDATGDFISRAPFSCALPSGLASPRLHVQSGFFVARRQAQDEMSPANGRVNWETEKSYEETMDIRTAGRRITGTGDCKHCQGSNTRDTSPGAYGGGSGRHHRAE